jgi:hypothetical protein
MARMRARDSFLALLVSGLAPRCVPSAPDASASAATASVDSTATASNPVSSGAAQDGATAATPSSASPAPGPAGSAALVPAAGRTTCFFDATLRSIQLRSQFTGDVWGLDLESRYVVELEVTAVSPDDGSQGQALHPMRTVAFAIHSPSRDLGVNPDEAAGKRLRLQVTVEREGDGVRYSGLRRAVAPQPAAVQKLPAAERAP